MLLHLAETTEACSFISSNYDFTTLFLITVTLYLAILIIAPFYLSVVTIF